MYSDSEIDAAVAAGLMTPAQAAQLRSFVAAERGAPAADEEYVRLLSSFNDVFVTAALMLALIGTAAFFGQIHDTPLLAFASIAGLSWLAAEYFTLRRKLALPSFFLFFAFAIGVPGAVFWALAPLTGLVAIDFNAQYAPSVEPFLPVATALSGLGACALHWYRFRVPVSVAVGALGAGAMAMALVGALAPGLMLSLSKTGPLLIGFAMFLIAMWWDMSDIYRQTRRADVAFWLHLAAAALIVHSTFGLLGVSPTSDTIGPGGALVTILLYLFFCLVALAIDRRAILVSSLIYVLTAFSTTLSFGAGPATPMAMTLSAIILGSGLLVLSVWWTRLRRELLARLPDRLRAQLPRAELEIARPRPVA